MTSYGLIIVFVIGIRLTWLKGQDCQLESPCMLNSSYGSIISPGYPNNYPDNIKLAWLINAPLGYSVRLIFQDFGLEDSNKCEYDYLAVYDGPNSTTGSPLLGKFCGSSKPIEQFSSSETLLVIFISDYMHKDRGFNISYETIKQVRSCSDSQSVKENLNIILNNSSGTLNVEYNNRTRDLNCVWKIRAPEGHGIRVTFTNMGIVQNTTCAMNSVYMFNGLNIRESNLIKTYCGEDYVFPIVKYIPERSVVIQLKTEQISSWDVKSFVVNYEFIEKDTSKCSSLNNLQENNNIALYGSYGKFKVDSTWKDMECRWKITAPARYQIRLTFVNMTLENDCRKAYIHVFDGINIDRGKFCGPEMPWVIFSTSGFLVVKLFVAGVSKAVQFTGLYEAVDKATGKCSAINSKDMNTNIWLNSSTSGVIMTPNYPSKYLSNFKCKWVITVPRLYRVKLHFKTFQIESHNCRYDYVVVRDGANSTITGKLCGESKVPEDIYSSSNRLWIHFVSDGNEERSGFLAYYSAVLPDPSKCSLANTNIQNNNIQVGGTSGYLTTPYYPNTSPSIKCTWYITVPKHQRIIVHFQEFNMVPWCHTVYFAVHDGSCTCDKSLGSFCDKNDSPSSVVSSGNHLTVVYSQPSNSQFKGFNLSFHSPKLGPGVCSVANPNDVNNRLYLNQSSGLVTSPDYPYSYFPGTMCTWYAMAPRGFHVLLTITHIDISNCYKNFLEVRDGALLNSPLKGRYCSIKKTKHIYSSGQNLVLRFVSPESIKDTGRFTANYLMIKDGNCSQDFDDSWNNNLVMNGKYGILTSPRYPQKYPSNIRCIWKLSVPYSQVKFTIKSLSFGGSCSSDFLEVRDGLSASDSLIRKFCKHSSAIELTSTGRFMLVQFQSGVNSSSGLGFEATFSVIREIQAAHSPFETVLIMGLVTFAGFIVLSLSLMCIYWLYKKRRASRRHRRASPPQPHDITVLSSIAPPTLDDIPDCLIAEDRPPSYNDAMQANDYEAQEEITSQERAGSRDDNSPEVADSTSLQMERGLDNLAFAADPPSYESLYGTEQ